MTGHTLTSISKEQETHNPNEDVWHESSRLLYTGQIDRFVAHWTPDGRYEVAFPITGMPAAVEGSEALRALFGGLGAAAAWIRVEDVQFHQTVDPDVAFVEERMVAQLHDGSDYRNRMVMRVSFRDGLIAEIFEYYGEKAHENLLRRLGVVA